MIHLVSPTELLKSELKCQKEIGFGQVNVECSLLVIYRNNHTLHLFNSAIWMLPTDSVYGDWPRSGEIDIVEIKGNADFSCNGNPIGRQLAGCTLHWGSDPSQNRYPLTH